MGKKGCMNLTQKRKLDRYRRWMERGKCVREGVRSGAGMSVRCEETEARRGLGVRMEIRGVISSG